MIQCCICEATYTKNKVLQKKVDSSDRIVYGCDNCKPGWGKKLPEKYAKSPQYGYDNLQLFGKSWE